MTQQRADEIVRKVIYARMNVLPKLKDSEEAFHVGRMIGQMQRQLEIELSAEVTESDGIDMTERRKYKKAFKIACELLNGSILYGYDSDRIFSEMMEKDGVVSSYSYEEFILTNLDRLDGKKCNRAESEDK